MAWWAAIPAVASLAKSLVGKGGDKGATSGGGTDWLGLANVGVGLLGGMNQSQQAGQSAQLQREQLAQQQRQFDATQQQQQGTTALNATQMDPLRQQRSRQQMALVEQLLKGAKSPTLNVGAGKFEGGLQYSPELFAQIASFFSPDARVAAEQQFGGIANTASGGKYGTPNLSAMGYGAAAGLPTPTTGMPSPVAAPPPGLGATRPSDDKEEQARRRRVLGY